MDKKKAADEYRKAREELEHISKREKHETPEWSRANKRVADAEKHVAWWKTGW